VASKGLLRDQISFYGRFDCAHQLGVHSFFGSINFVDSIILSLLCFLFSLVVTRMFDKQIVNATAKVIAYLGKYQRIRTMVIDHLRVYGTRCKRMALNSKGNCLQ